MSAHIPDSRTHNPIDFKEIFFHSPKQTVVVCKADVPLEKHPAAKLAVFCFIYAPTSVYILYT